ncbi:hypothetical protein ACH0B5_15645 [Ureibacillus sp. 179-F W5.1 NHS]|uniref:Uncharacterized protein n=1 Tax=Lysinibacillus halotolerans TaxID=1368476 RepID=A0A3M8H1F0_9BACI|nr:hypothetical protein [Lysinibacillus halotolerans]RNC96253.1 hypothetical protein EC501_17190 [Lysinibacillus halotolerans]
MIDWPWTEVDTLESQEKWNEAFALLLKHWNENPNDLKTVIRLGFLSWYVLVEEGPLDIKGVDFDGVETVLREVTSYGLTHFSMNEDFLWSFGYMMSLFPDYFGDDDCEQKGKGMLKRAYELCPDEPIYRYTYFGAFPNEDDKLREAIQQVHAVLDDRFQGEGVLSAYFQSVWGSPTVNR